MAAYAIKAEVADPASARFVFIAVKTMYGGKAAALGDTVFIFASGTEGRAGLVARGVVEAVEATPRRPDLARQTPRISLTLRRTGVASRPLGRRELRGFQDWNDGRPETELNFKVYRQATDKLVGVSDVSAA